MKGVQCNELFGGIALKNRAFSFFYFSIVKLIKHGIDVKERVLK